MARTPKGPTESGRWQQLFPWNTCFTEKDVPDLTGKVVIVTGSNSGIGYEHVKMLYEHSATVYMATRSAAKADAAIAKIKAQHPESRGRLEFLSLDLSRFGTIKASADTFLGSEDRLDVLVQNAGIMQPAAGSYTMSRYGAPPTYHPPPGFINDTVSRYSIQNPLVATLTIAND